MWSRWLHLVVGLIVAWACAAGGCGVSGAVKLRAVSSGGELEPQVRVLAYSADDGQTADIYLTDLGLNDLDPGIDPGSLTGSFIHIHQFLQPRAGRTPIESTASSVTIRYVVLSKGSIGIYGGGGFLLPRGKPGDSTFGGTMRNATLKLVEANATFHDPLGACTLTASFRAPLDPSLARLMAARLDDFMAQAKKRE